MKQAETVTSEYNDILNSARTALAKGEKRLQEVTSQLEDLEELQQEKEAILASNAKFESLLSAAGGAPAPKASALNGKATAPKASAKTTITTKSGKVDGRSKEARAAKAAAAAKVSAKPAAAAKAPVAKKTAAKKTAKAPAAKKAAKADVSNATEGRRAQARGDRPTLKEAIATVMGKLTLSASEVVAGLEKKGWMPNAKDPQQYVSFMLSSNKETFERVARGQYKVQDGATVSPKKATTTKAPKAKAPKAETSSKKASKKASSTDEELKDLLNNGPGAAPNPFLND